MNNERFFTLHRHWMWCNYIKMNFVVEVAKRQNETLKEMLTGIRPMGYSRIMASKYGAYMSIWYALLFVVLEGLREERITIPEIKNDINDIYEPLRLYRNAVFHPQPKYWSHKLFEIMKDKNSADKIWKVHDRLGQYFLGEINKRKPNE